MRIRPGSIVIKKLHYDNDMKCVYNESVLISGFDKIGNRVIEELNGIICHDYSKYLYISTAYPNEIVDPELDEDLDFALLIGSSDDEASWKEAESVIDNLRDNNIFSVQFTIGSAESAKNITRSADGMIWTSLNIVKGLIDQNLNEGDLENVYKWLADAVKYFLAMIFNKVNSDEERLRELLRELFSDGCTYIGVGRKVGVENAGIATYRAFSGIGACLMANDRKNSDIISQCILFSGDVSLIEVDEGVECLLDIVGSDVNTLFFSDDRRDSEYLDVFIIVKVKEEAKNEEM